MKHEKSAISTVIPYSCDGGFFGRHDRIIVSGLDNKFRTLSASMARALSAKGFQITSEGETFVIAETHAKVGDLSQAAQLNFDVGSSFWKTGERQKAIGVWEDNVSRFPDHRDSWYNLGLAYARDENNDRAMECLTRALTIDASDGQTWWYVGYILRRMGRDDESRQAYRKAQGLGWQQPPL